MTSEEAAESLLRLSQLAQRGKPSDIARIIDRLLALYPSQGAAPQSVKEDWVRVLKDQPIASVWEAYERTIRKPGQWAPSLGDFLRKVEQHAHSVNTVMIALQK